MPPKKRGNFKSTTARMAAKKRWEKYYKKKGIKPTRPKRNPSTVVMRYKAQFDKQWYTVYAKEGTPIRTIFPRMDKHPEFAKADFGTKFKVIWMGKHYTAIKEARWQENGARVPCLTWKIRTE